MKRVFLELTELNLDTSSYHSRHKVKREKVAINMTRVQEMRPYPFEDIQGVKIIATELRMNIPNYTIIVGESIPNIMLRLETLNGDEQSKSKVTTSNNG